MVDEGRTEVARTDKPRLVGEDHRLHAVAQVEFRQDAGHVTFHGRLAEEERGGDLSVGHAAGEKAQDIELTFAQSAYRVGLRALRGWSAAEVLDQSAGDGRREHGLARVNGADSSHELFAPRVLEQE